jgi:formylglycine-generating enzyme required for sulfatase activity
MRIYLQSRSVLAAALMLFAAVSILELQAQAHRESPWKKDQRLRILKDVPREQLATLRELGTNPSVGIPLRAVSTPSVEAVKENPRDGLKYVWVVPGSFQMGCSLGDKDCFADEKPAHHVTITKGFWIGQTEVTVGAYKRFAGIIGKSMPSNGNTKDGWSNEKMPMGAVTWNDAQSFCQWAGGRLPTEAEWEYAARGGTAEARYGPIDDVAWWTSNSGMRANQVGGRRPNGFGLFDMLGNMWEWVSDWYDVAYYKHSLAADPPGPSSGSEKVLRGGAYAEIPQFVRASVRHFKLAPNLTGANLGFRCVGGLGNP